MAPRTLIIGDKRIRVKILEYCLTCVQAITTYSLDLRKPEFRLPHPLLYTYIIHILTIKNPMYTMKSTNGSHPKPSTPSIDFK